jgi:GNAT superfamily N-acetyltransferase
MVEIKELAPTRSNLLKFINFQIEMYKNNNYFVPPLVLDELDTLNPSKNPAFDFCESAYFAAYRDGKMVGRIAGIINRQVNEKENQKNVRFGFVDFIDDREVSKALLDAVARWGKSKGMDSIVGPLSFTDLDKEGVLVDGYEELSTMATIYNYPYYVEHFKAYGMEVDSTWLEFVMDVPDEIPAKMNRIADIVKERFGLKVLKFKSRKEVKERYGHALFDLINETYASLYGYSTLTERQIDAYIKMYLNLLDLDLVCFIVDSKEELVGIGVSMQSMSRALQKSHGKLFPFGWYHLLKGLKGKNDRVDLLLVGIKPEYQGKGVNALLFQDLIPQYIKRGFKWAESNPELATNDKVQGQWQYFKNRNHRKRVALKKTI